MKRKFLILSFAMVLCLSLSSCDLKKTITGENSTDKDSITTSNNTNKEDNITNNEFLENDATDTTDNSDILDDTNNTNENTSNKDSLSNSITKNDSNDKSVETVVSQSNSNSIVSRDCRIFYFNSSDSKTYYIDTKVEVTDNAFVTALTKRLYQAPNSDTNLLVLPKDFGVKSATLDYETEVLKVVFNEDFTLKMNLDSSSKDALISAIVNTYGYNYGIDKVSIYFGNTLYKGASGNMTEDYFIVDSSNALKLN